MADIKISSATNVGMVLGTDKIPLARSGSPAAYFATAAEIKSYTGGGGGGGSYTAGNGLYFTGTSPTTIGNTGTIDQPDATTAAGNGIVLIGASDATGTLGAGGVYLRAGTLSNVSSIGYAANIFVKPGDLVLTNGTAYGSSGGFTMPASQAIYGGSIATSGRFFTGGGQGYPALDMFNGGPAALLGGAANGTAGVGGHATIVGGSNISGAGPGGNAIVKPGTGATNGVVLLPDPMPTTDPHNLGAVFQSATANLLGNYQLYRSQG